MLMIPQWWNWIHCDHTTDILQHLKRSSETFPHPRSPLSSTREEKKKKEKELQKNVGAPKAEIIVPGYSCVPSANFVETLGMTNLRTHKMLIASLAGKSPWIKLTRRENHCMLCKFKQAWCTLWLNSSNLSSENYTLLHKREFKQSDKERNR